MKKIMIVLICWVCGLAVFAQDVQPTKSSAETNEIKTLFGNGKGAKKIPLGYFFELNGGYSQFGHKNVFLPGMSLGVILDHHWTVGLSGSFIGVMDGLRFNNIYYDSVSNSMKGANLKGGYGGLLLEYTLFPNSRLHLAFPLLIGGGYMFYSQQSNHDSIQDNYNHGFHHNYISSDNFFVVEPGVRLECNIIRKLRLGLGVSYRYSPDLKLKNTPSDLINQFTAKLSLRFGKF